MVPRYHPDRVLLAGASELTVPFWKTEALANDFVLVHPDDLADHDLSDVAEAVCDRHKGVGADGLLVFGPDLTLRMFNPDGTEDFCGNGLRCAAWHAHRQGWADDQFRMSHRGVWVPASVAADGQVSVELGTPSFDSADIPLDPTTHPEELWQERLFGFTASTVSTGTAHTVILVDEIPSDTVFFEISRQIEHAPLFPERTSVIWVAPRQAFEAELRIWERGAGETMACGTGNVAVAAVLTRLNGRGGEYTFHNPGGTAKVSIMSDLTRPVITSLVGEPFTGTFTMG